LNVPGDYTLGDLHSILQIAFGREEEHLHPFTMLHEIAVSKSIPIGDGDRDSALPRCLAGKRAGPPEDSGGIWDYRRMLEILQNPDHAEYKEIHDWAGDIDPEYAGLEEINQPRRRAAKLDLQFER
jgi:hypothetical protein